MGLMIWDYFKKGNKEKWRGPSYSVCVDNGTPNYNNSECIEGVNYAVFSSTESNTCLTSESKESCEKYKNFNVDGDTNKWGAYKKQGTLMGEIVIGEENSQESKEWKKGWIDVNKLERLHICEKKNCKRGYFSCKQSIEKYLKLYN